MSSGSAFDYSITMKFVAFTVPSVVLGYCNWGNKCVLRLSGVNALKIKKISEV